MNDKFVESEFGMNIFISELLNMTEKSLIDFVSFRYWSIRDLHVSLLLRKINDSTDRLAHIHTHMCVCVCVVQYRGMFLFLFIYLFLNL